MAKIVNNDKGFKVISLSVDEAGVLEFGVEGTGLCICMKCNKYIIPSSVNIKNEAEQKKIVHGDIYYVAVLNDTMCRDCYEEWLKDATRYVEDIPIEERNFNYYKEALGL